MSAASARFRLLPVRAGTARACRLNEFLERGTRRKSELRLMRLLLISVERGDLQLCQVRGRRKSLSDSVQRPKGKLCRLRQSF